MRILAIDMGTGTQDILLFDTEGPAENSLKMVMPSATEIAARRIRRATLVRRPLLLTGVTMGGGPCHWALEAHLKAGYAAYATPEAARTFDDDLEVVARMGVQRGQRGRGPPTGRRRARARCGTWTCRPSASRWPPSRWSPSSTAWPWAAWTTAPRRPATPTASSASTTCAASSRSSNDLRAFAYLPEEVPDYLTRARSMLSCVDFEAPTVFLDTGPAAALGALQDPRVAGADEQLVLNLGNMHTLAFHLRGTHIYSLYEHHTGLLEPHEIESLTEGLMAGTLRHEDVFDRHGHGVYYVPDAARVRRPALPGRHRPAAGQAQGEPPGALLRHAPRRHDDQRLLRDGGGFRRQAPAVPRGDRGCPGA